MVDKLNLLGVSAVPITVFIDEAGIVQAVRPAQKDVEAFLNEDFSQPKLSEKKEKSPPNLHTLQEAVAGGDPSALRNYAENLFLWGGMESLGGVIEAYDKALQAEPSHAPTHFSLGVAYRNRYDSPSRRPQDFNNAIKHWKAALEIDPNQYIWRRRIQQYGPRLDKPYPFYDWVIPAREDIAARGETPSPLMVEPTGSEIANPARTFETSTTFPSNPDPQGRINRDEQGLILTEITVVPNTANPSSHRVHLAFRPNLGLKAHWNNEAEDQVFWIDPPLGWEVDRRWVSIVSPPEIVSQEERRVEFEIKGPEDLGAATTIPAYTLYYVCEDVDGTCLYRRQDVLIKVSSDN